MLHDDLYTLRNVRFMQLHKTGDLPFCIGCLAAGIFFDFFVQLIVPSVTQPLRTSSAPSGVASAPVPWKLSPAAAS